MKSHSSMSNIGGHNSGSQVLRTQKKEKLVYVIVKYNFCYSCKPESWPAYANEEPFQGPIKRRMSYPVADGKRI